MDYLNRNLSKIKGSISKAADKFREVITSPNASSTSLSSSSHHKKITPQDEIISLIHSVCEVIDRLAVGVDDVDPVELVPVSVTVYVPVP